MLADLHLHSEYSKVAFSYAYEKPLKIIYFLLGIRSFESPKIEDILKRAGEVGLKIVSITDHDQTEGTFKAQRLGDKYRLLVIPGIEISTKEGHVIGLGLKKQVSIPQNRKFSINEALELIHEQEGIAVAAHPFHYSWLEISVNRKTIFSKSFDALETFNASVPNKKYRQEVKRIAQKLHLGQTGGSDAHTLDFIGWGVTEFSDQVGNINDALKEIKEGKTRTSGRDVSKLLLLRSIYRVCKQYDSH